MACRNAFALAGGIACLWGLSDNDGDNCCQPSSEEGLVNMSLDFVLFYVVLRVVFALPVASLFERKGYGYGRFFLIGFLLDPFSCFALYLLMPRLRSRRARSTRPEEAAMGGEAA